MKTDQELRDIVNGMVDKRGHMGALAEMKMWEASEDRRCCIEMLTEPDKLGEAMAVNGDIDDMSGGY